MNKWEKALTKIAARCPNCKQIAIDALASLAKEDLCVMCGARSRKGSKFCSDKCRRKRWRERPQSIENRNRRIRIFALIDQGNTYKKVSEILGISAGRIAQLNRSRKRPEYYDELGYWKHHNDESTKP